MIVRGWYPDGTMVDPWDYPKTFIAVGTRRAPMDSTDWAGLIVLVSCVVTVVGCSL